MVRLHWSAGRMTDGRSWEGDSERRDQCRQGLWSWNGSGGRPVGPREGPNGRLLHLCKFVLGVSRKATNDAVRGEVGRLPILLITVQCWVSFTKRGFCLPQENLLKCSLPPATDFGKNEKSSWSAHMFNMMSLCNGISYSETPLLSLF